MENKEQYNEAKLYNGLERPRKYCYIVESAGTGFVGGIFGGFFYHLMKFKGVSGTGSSRLASALTKAPRVGGFGVLFSMATDFPVTAAGYLTNRHISHMYDYLALPGAAALMWSPRGFRSASRPTLLWGSFAGACAVIDAYLTRTG